MLKMEMIGHLGADAEVKEFNGNKFVSFNVAHTEKRNGGERTTWVSCTRNGDGGKILPFLKRGTQVFIRGDFNVELYQGRNGYAAGVKCFVSEIQLVGGTNDNAGTNAAQSASGDDDRPF